MLTAERPSTEPVLKRVPLHDLHVARGEDRAIRQLRNAGA